MLNRYTVFPISMSLMIILASCRQDSPEAHVPELEPSADKTVILEPTPTQSQKVEDIIPDKEGTPVVGESANTGTISSTSTPSEEVAAINEGWRRLDTTGGGAQTGIATHPTNPDIVYMASDNGGLFKTENGGDSWFSVSSNLGAYRLGFVILDPLNPEVIYVTASTDYGLITSGGDTGEIHRSLNGGNSWEFVADGMGFQNSFPSQAAIIIPYNPTNPKRFDGDDDGISDIILVGAWTGPADPPVGGIWRSEDEGTTFIQLALEDRNITALRGDGDVIFAATHEGEIYRSEDLGENWESITGDLPLVPLADLALHPADENIMYVTCRWCGDSVGLVWKTVDGGKHWQPAMSGLDTDEIGGLPKILIDRFDANTLYVTTRSSSEDKGGVYKSVDAGDSWQLMPFGLVLPDGRPYFWYQFEGKFALGQTVDGRLFAGGEGGWRYPAGNGREEWEPATLGVGNIHVNTIEVDPSDSTVLYQGISDFGPYKSEDQGVSFYRILGNGWPVTVDNYVWNGPYYTNYGKCELACSATCQGQERISAGGTTDFAVSRQDSLVVYSSFGSGSGGSKQGGVNKSTDGGKTWLPLGYQLEAGFLLSPDSCLPYGFRYLAIDPRDDQVVYAAQEVPTTEKGVLYRSVDGGDSWTKVFESDEGYISGIETSEVAPGLVMLSTRSGVYKSEEGGKADSWQVVTPEGASNIRTVRVSPHQRQVYVIGTNDQGIYYTADGGVSWSNYRFDEIFAQKLEQGTDEKLFSEIATAVNPGAYVLRNISVIIFDPVRPDTFYIGGTQYTRASFGVAKITNAGQNWERLSVAGLSHRNIFDLAIDPTGESLYAGTFDGTYRLELSD